MMYRWQHGSILTFVLLGLLAVSVLATIAYGSYYQISRGTQDTINRANTSALLIQASYILTKQSENIDLDCVVEPLAVGSPAGDGAVPASSGAPGSDGWGTPLKYCTWNNSNPLEPGAVQFALLSAGPDKAFDTLCADVKTQLRPNGDDLWRTVTLAQQNQGVGENRLYGDPVTDWTALRALPTTCEPFGLVRITLDTQVPYFWSGTTWLPLNGAGLEIDGNVDVNCTEYPPGTLAHDAVDNLYMCTKSKLWKKMSP